MVNVTRYDLNEDLVTGELFISPVPEKMEGGYVSYEDYAALQQKLDAMAVSWNIVCKSGEPGLPVGESKSYWVCYRSNGDQNLRVSQAVWFNQSKPEGLDEDDDADCELYTPDGEPYWPVGWHEAYCHEDFSTYYLGWGCGQILAYAELKLPQIPVQLLSGTHDTADKAG